MHSIENEIVYVGFLLLGAALFALVKAIVGKEPKYSSLEREEMLAYLEELEEKRKSAKQRLLDDLRKKQAAPKPIVANNSREQQLIENERERIKEVLHDYTIQQLVAIAIYLEGVRDLASNEKLRNTVDFTIRELYKTIDSVRYLIHNLSLPYIGDKSLLELVHELEVESNNYLRLRIVTHQKSPEKAFILTREETLELFLIVREALQNCIKYTDSTQLHIYLDWQNGLEMEVEDNGYGLPAKPKAGIGMLSMKKRAERIGGTFDIISRTASGLAVIVTLPARQQTH